MLTGKKKVGGAGGVAQEVERLPSKSDWKFLEAGCL
jgi:hypothetical protein